MKRFSIIILAGGFGVSFQMFYPTIPKALVPLGHTPGLCIMLETLLELGEFIDQIYLLVFERHTIFFEKEIHRWFFNNDKINIVPLPDCPGTAKSIDFFLHENRMMNDHIIIMHSNTPLISKMTVKDFCIYCSEMDEYDIIAMVSKMKKKDYHLVTIFDKALISIGDEQNSDFSFLNVFFIRKQSLTDNIGIITPDENTKEYHIYEIINLCKGKKTIFMVNPFTANRECIIIKKIEDKNFAEEIYLENRNANFIHQCFGLWKQCDQFDRRLQNIEILLQKHSIT